MQEKNLKSGFNLKEIMNNYNCLDLDVIKEKVSEFAYIKEAKDFILQESIDFNPLVIKRLNQLTLEAIKIIKSDINIQFSGITCVNQLFEKASKDFVLDSNELKDTLVFHNHLNRIKELFNSINNEFLIKDFTDSLVINNDVFDEIDRCIDNSGNIKDNATDKLYNLKNELYEQEKNIYNKADIFINKNSSSLQELSIFKRDDRVCFLVKNSDKNKFAGYSHGSSSSGLANYIEPGTFFEDNNRIINLKRDIDDEINAILKKLSYLLSDICLDYITNFDSIVELCVIFAKANYGIKNNCIVPEFVDGKYFDFVDLCHPLIDSKTVVCNSYRLYEPYKGIVISGTNTGGKTVSLKVIGLSIVMSYIGIPIIASFAKIPFYKNIFVDIDDNQSIKDSLSTFSAHIFNINNILNNADENSLILIDELISGTDPKEAQAISLSILDKIKEKNSIFIVTTHYDDIKKYSFDDKEVLLSSVGFDVDNLKPTYKYSENTIGVSNALKIASVYFDDSSIISKAYDYLNKTQTKEDELLNSLSIKTAEVDKKINEYNSLIAFNNELKEKNENQIKQFEFEKNSLKEKYISDLNDYVNDVKSKALNKLDLINNKEDKKILKELDELIIENNLENIQFNVGDNVRILENEQIGIITSLNGDIATIDLKGLTIKSNIIDLKLMPKLNNKKAYIPKEYKNNVSKDLNVVGCHVEEALVLIEKYLDDANCAKLKTVKIIHGYGTGALRQAIRNKLKNISFVNSFNDGDFYDGGSAVTVVNFK